MSRMQSLRRAKGLTLLEIMISMAIGLVVVGAVMVSFIGSGKAGRYQSALSQMNQDAQIALSMLSREIQMAGYSAPASLTDMSGGGTPNFVITYNLGTLTAPIFGCDSTRGTSTFADPTAASLTCNTATTPTTSGFGVVYQADVKNTVPGGVSSDIPTDCLGSTIDSGTSIYYARNRYFVSTGSSGRPELYCASNKAGGSAMPLLENVEDMQVWYGMQGATDRQVTRYAKAGNGGSISSTVNAVASTTNELVNAGEWRNVISVRICLLMRSYEPVFNETVVATGNEDTLTYLDCDSITQTSTDRYLRRAYFTTATLRAKMAF